MKKTTLSKSERTRLGALKTGWVLLVIFLVTTVLLLAGLTVLICLTGWKSAVAGHLLYIILAAAAVSLLFWTGIIIVYVTSIQLGIRERVIGIVAGPVPVANIFALIHIIRVAAEECRTEKEKDRLNVSREQEQVCRTRYPLLLVHGVFFRDFVHLNYWGRIPAELEKNGAAIFYGNHQSASSVPGSAEELTERIKRITEETGCGKVNVIAHSKGGLDIRYACSCLDAAPYVASVTTVNTPHRGCEFADFLLGKAGEGLKEKLAAAYNAGARKLGDHDPDFISAVTDLTSGRVKELNSMMSDFDFREHGIFTRSTGSHLKHMTGGRFPLNMTYYMVRYFDGPNDGLVGYDSFPFGEDFRYLEPSGRRGISHGDMIDLNREDIPGFDVREFYVGLVADLKERGL